MGFEDLPLHSPAHATVDTTHTDSKAKPLIDTPAVVVRMDGAVKSPQSPLLSHQLKPTTHTTCQLRNGVDHHTGKGKGMSDWEMPDTSLKNVPLKVLDTRFKAAMATATTPKDTTLVTSTTKVTAKDTVVIKVTLSNRPSHDATSDTVHKDGSVHKTASTTTHTTCQATSGVEHHHTGWDKDTSD